MVFEPTSLEHGLPSSFDLGRHRHTLSVVATKKDSFPKSWEQFHPAWRAVPLRLLWTMEHNDAFTESIVRAGSAPPWPDRYIQDQQVFAFFVDGLSAVEVACYAIYAVGSIASPPHFPISLSQDLRHINTRSTYERLKAAFSEDPLTETIHTVVANTLFEGEIRERGKLNDKRGTTSALDACFVTQKANPFSRNSDNSRAVMFERPKPVQDLGPLSRSSSTTAEAMAINPLERGISTPAQSPNVA